MRVIIAGSRALADALQVDEAVTASGWRSEITQVVSGNAKGVDRMGEWWAFQNDIHVKKFPVDGYAWGRWPGIAALLRNAIMAGYADALIAVWDGESKGTSTMIDLMRWIGKPVFVWQVDPARVLGPVARA